MISSWTFVIIIATLMTYKDKKDKVKLASKRSYFYIATDAIMRIAILSIVMKYTMEIMIDLLN